MPARPNFALTRIRLVLTWALLVVTLVMSLGFDDLERPFLPLLLALLIGPRVGWDGTRRKRRRTTRADLLVLLALFALLALTLLIPDETVALITIAALAAATAAAFWRLDKQADAQIASGVVAPTAIEQHSEDPQGKRPSIRRAVYLAPLFLAALGFALIPYGPPCESFVNGPCERNWVTHASTVVLVLVVPAALVALGLAATDAFRRLRKRD